MQILTHRGLEPLNPNFFFWESSKEAFFNQLERGYGIEFDVNFWEDGTCFIFHDNDLKRLKNSHLISFVELLQGINTYRKFWEYSALHLKSKFQTMEYLDNILLTLEKFSWIEEKVFIFDVKPETAHYLKKRNNNLKLFASLSHPYDIQRYNDCTWWTLLSIEEILKERDFFDGVWLDERDRKNFLWEKSLYNPETFRILRKHWLLISVVSPELHSSSPWLLWGESHEDAQDEMTLKKRIEEIQTLQPDFICTDYPRYYEYSIIQTYTNFTGLWRNLENHRESS
jgi:hypothetical protein